MHRRIIFTDRSVVDFCKATQDINTVHDPGFMGSLGKRVIVPGMFAFSSTAILAADFIKTRADYIRVCFNTLLSSGDFADLVAVPDSVLPAEIRLSAINHKDTLTSADDYTRISRRGLLFVPQSEGKIRHLEVSESHIRDFARLIMCHDPELAGFLFSIAYASQALYAGIREASTVVEKEIDRLINGNNRISPFYHTLEIFLPPNFPFIIPNGTIGYRIHFIREKENRAYVANLQCEQEGRIIYRSVYKLVGIPDSIILRMAKGIHHTPGKGS